MWWEAPNFERWSEEMYEAKMRDGVFIMGGYQCTHHPRYDPTSGEPTNILAHRHSEWRAHCWRCWKAYAYYQEYRATRYNSLNNEFEQRIKGLEQLIDAIEDEIGE